jgi:acyl dehydratase
MAGPATTTPTTVFRGIAELSPAVGSELGVSDWLTVTQQMVDQFAESTGDHQWIHVDPERAASGPFGTTIAHGYLTLALLPVLAEQIFRVDDVTLAINYGTNRVRFPQPVPVGSRIRARATLTSVRSIALGTQVRVLYTIELEGSEKPACVAVGLTVYGQ